MKAAIELLKQELEESEDQEKRHEEVGVGYTKYWSGRTKQLHQALAVLEASEKVDKSRALILLDSMHIPLRDDLAFKIKGQIHALLESLPEKE